MMKISILFAILFMFYIAFAAHSVQHDESLPDTGSALFIDILDRIVNPDVRMSVTKPTAQLRT